MTKVFGYAQSPINIDTSSIQAEKKMLVRLNYGGPIEVAMSQSHHGIVCRPLVQDDELAVGEETYTLSQLHFHRPSEHHVDGRSYPVCIHFVHQSRTEKFAVLSLFVDVGATEHSAYVSLLESMSNHVRGLKTVEEPVDMRGLFPDSRDVYHYQGSLTTPPYTEGVQWFIFKEPVRVNPDQVEIFRSALKIDNARQLQDLNDRPIFSVILE